MDNTLILIFLICAVVAIVGWVWSAARVNKIVDTFARDHNLTVLNRNSPWFSLDPFVLFAGKTRLVYRLKVQDREGNIRHAMLRAGGRWSGLTSDEYEVKWLD
jgi:hypothetical protein